LNQLQALDLRLTRVTDAGLKDLAGLKLSELFIPAATQTDLGLKVFLTINPDRPKLDLSGWNVTNDGLKELARLKHLQSLNLRDTKVTDSGLKDLAGLNLKDLALPDAALTDLGLKHYLAAIAPPSELDLMTWEVTDAGLKELAGLKQVRSLSLGRK